MTAALERGKWSAARPGHTLPPGKTRYPFYRRLGGPQGRSGRAENLVPTGIRSRTVQPIVSCYTDWATRPTMSEYYIIQTPTKRVYVHYKQTVMTEILGGVHYVKLWTHNFPEAGFPFSGGRGKWETLLWWGYEKESVSVGLNQETWSIALSRSRAMSKISVTVIQSVTSSLSVDRNIHDNTYTNLTLKSDLCQFNPISTFKTYVSEDSLQQGLAFPRQEVYSFRKPQTKFCSRFESVQYCEV